MTLLAVLLLFGAVCALFICSVQSGLLREHSFRVLLLAGAELLTVLIVLFRGQEFFYRTAVTVAFTCLFEVLLAAPLPAKARTAALIALYAGIALLYLLIASS